MYYLNAVLYCCREQMNSKSTRLVFSLQPISEHSWAKGTTIQSTRSQFSLRTYYWILKEMKQSQRQFSTKISLQFSGLLLPSKQIISSCQINYSNMNKLTWEMKILFFPWQNSFLYTLEGQNMTTWMILLLNW